MKRLPILLAFMLLMGLLSSSAFGISFEEARHLLARTGFGGNWEQMQQFRPSKFPIAGLIPMPTSATFMIAYFSSWQTQ